VTPDLCRAIFSSCRQGRLQAARYLQKRLEPLGACLSQHNPAALKYALSLLGLMDPTTRLPLVELDGPAKAAVARAITDIADEDLLGAAEA
jgi:4-hydroxy-tetrahydrodipicolinate synthase